MGMTVQELIEALTEVGDKSASVVFEDNGRIFKTSSRFEICEDFSGVVIIRERNNQMTECYGTQNRRNMGKVIIWHDWKHRVPNFTIGNETTCRSGDWCKIWVKELDDEITIEWPFYFRLSSFGYLLLTYFKKIWNTR